MARTPDLSPPVKLSPARTKVEADIGRAVATLTPYDGVQGIDGVLDTGWAGVRDRLQKVLDRAKEVWATGKAKAKEAADKAREYVGRAAKNAAAAVGKASDLFDDFKAMYIATQDAARAWGLVVLVGLCFAVYKWQTRGMKRR